MSSCSTSTTHAPDGPSAAATHTSAASCCGRATAIPLTALETGHYTIAVTDTGRKNHVYRIGRGVNQRTEIALRGKGDLDCRASHRHLSVSLGRVWRGNRAFPRQIARMLTRRGTSTVKTRSSAWSEPPLARQPTGFPFSSTACYRPSSTPLGWRRWTSSYHPRSRARPAGI
jgi:hypothetical protein